MNLIIVLLISCMPCVVTKTNMHDNKIISAVIALSGTAGSIGMVNSERLGLILRSPVYPKIKVDRRKARFIPVPVRPEDEDGCKALNESCIVDYDCCKHKYMCVGERDADAVCTQCKELGENCVDDGECCSLWLCVNQACLCLEDGETCAGHASCCGTSICAYPNKITFSKFNITSNKSCGPCFLADEPCSDKYDCCNRRCNLTNNVCFCSVSNQPCASSLECCEGLNCRNSSCVRCNFFGDACARDDECCGDLKCRYGSFKLCEKLSGVCLHDDDCCSKNCSVGVCRCGRRISRKKRCTFG